MKDIFASFLSFIAIIAVILGLSWVFTGNDFFLYKYFAPKQEAVRRQVFEQSKAYNQGMIQELESLQHEYITTDKQHQEALACLIRHRYADYDRSKLPLYLQQFLNQIY